MIFYKRNSLPSSASPVELHFTQSEFVDVVKKCKAGGYAGVANAVGNRNYPALYPIWAGLVNLEGNAEQVKYDSGQKKWDTPTAEQVLDWDAELSAAGMWPETFSTMTIDEFHVFFHTQKKACMFYIPSFYTGRAFKPVESGGQSPDFHFGMLRYPTMDGAQHTDELWAAGDSGYMVMSTSKHPNSDILKFLPNPYARCGRDTIIPSPQVLRGQDWPTDLRGLIMEVVFRRFTRST